MTVFAHAGHWATGVIEAAPFLILVVWLLATTWRDRRRAAREARDSSGAEPEHDGDPPRRADH
jgi:hypothetical protein